MSFYRNNPAPINKVGEFFLLDFGMKEVVFVILRTARLSQNAKTGFRVTLQDEFGHVWVHMFIFEIIQEKISISGIPIEIKSI